MTICDIEDCPVAANVTVRLYNMFGPDHIFHVCDYDGMRAKLGMIDIRELIKDE